MKIDHIRAFWQHKYLNVHRMFWNSSETVFFQCNLNSFVLTFCEVWVFEPNLFHSIQNPTGKTSVHFEIVQFFRRRCTMYPTPNSLNFDIFALKCSEENWMFMFADLKFLWAAHKKCFISAESQSCAVHFTVPFFFIILFQFPFSDLSHKFNSVQLTIWLLWFIPFL